MNKAGLNSIPEFPKSESVGPRDWGEEILVSLVPEKFMMKKLYINKGSKGGLQYHRLKDEVHIIIKGKMLITYDDGTGNLVNKVLDVGDVAHYPPGTIHQEEALEDCYIIEASTNHFNDRVRCEELYGVEVLEGLPTTQAHEIEEK
jgi:mannose-6-phosphate isomerase-like protein (cupin superfamily)